MCKQQIFGLKCIFFFSLLYVWYSSTSYLKKSKKDDDYNQHDAAIQWLLCLNEGELLLLSPVSVSIQK